MGQAELVGMILAVPAETQAMEFKRLGASNNDIAHIVESAAAMANTEGGVIILGVDDPEKTKVKGLDRIRGIEENLEHFDALGRELQKLVPPIGGIWPPQIIDVPQLKKRIGLLHIPKASDSFRSFNNHVYVRQEKSNRRLNPQEIVKFAYAKGFTKADGELVEIDINLLDTDILKIWRESRGLQTGDLYKILKATGLARENDQGGLLPTRAAVLLFAEHPNDLLETRCTVRVFQYAGTIETIRETLNLIGTPKTIGGPIATQIREAHEYVLTLLRSGLRVPSGFVTEYQLPERVVKEAITNAIIHRDYHLKRDIEIRIFEDRVEVESPGLFPYNITRMNIGYVRSDGYRNDLLVKHLREFPSPPNLDQNEGVRVMRQEMRSRGLYPPIFQSYPLLQDVVRVVLLNEKSISEWEKVSAYLREHKYIANEEARDITGIVQRDKMARMFRNWVKQGLLVRLTPPTGYVRNTKYRLPEGTELQK